MAHIPFDGFDQVWNEIMAAGELNIDLSKAVANSVTLVDQSFLNADRPKNDRSYDTQEY
jgi:hypothetical protein